MSTTPATPEPDPLVIVPLHVKLLLESIVQPLAAIACNPDPLSIAVDVRAAADVVQVAQAIVPVVVIVPPVIGDVVAMLLTVPLPPPPAHGFQRVVAESQQITLVFDGATLEK